MSVSVTKCSDLKPLFKCCEQVSFSALRKEEMECMQQMPSRMSKKRSVVFVYCSKKCLETNALCAEQLRGRCSEERAHVRKEQYCYLEQVPLNWHSKSHGLK